jgi:hypothetical protein
MTMSKTSVEEAQVTGNHIVKNISTAFLKQISTTTVCYSDVNRKSDCIQPTEWGYLMSFYLFTNICFSRTMMFVSKGKCKKNNYNLHKYTPFNTNPLSFKVSLYKQKSFFHPQI